LNFFGFKTDHGELRFKVRRIRGRELYRTEALVELGAGPLVNTTIE
jgi:hypothetical protein